MPTGAYERYGLTGNPFRDLASENLENVEVFHVDLAVDEALASMKEEVYARENKAFVAVVGQHGAGKTERLLLASIQARQRGANVGYFSISERAAWGVPGLAQAFLNSAGLGGFARVFSAPPWYRALQPLLRTKPNQFDPVRAGRALGHALNARAPSFLLLNDLHNLSAPAEADLFAKTLQELSDAIRPGVFVMVGALPAYFVELTRNRPTLSSRINRTIILPTLSEAEAGLLLAKKLLAKRLVENLDPLYPFDGTAVAELNRASFGNPRRLLELADRAIELAAGRRAYRVDAELVQTALLPPRPVVPVPTAAPSPPAAIQLRAA
ncbi:MAG TPA: hypothetical protein VEY07_07925 [Thermoplasmata archaeon]|nr:hypothetical protein [Thermoplasmata archaeon]